MDAADKETCIITLSDITSAQKLLEASPHCIHTPLLSARGLFDVDGSIDLYLKLENMQVLGSFKIRGIHNQLAQLPLEFKQHLVTCSAGNYGRSFAYLTSQSGLSGTVVMPEDAPISRQKKIKEYGASVVLAPNTLLFPTVQKYVNEQNMLFLHSFDDPLLVAGHGTAGLEIIQDLPDADVVLVGCGGGGVVAGIAASVKLSGKSSCKIYAVEPEGAALMYQSFREGRAASDMPVNTIAKGLAPPCVGETTFKHCKRFVDGIFLVTDREIAQAVMMLFEKGLVVEPSGAAAFAALIFNKVPNILHKKVVVVLTGGNVTPEELTLISKMTESA